MNDASFILKRLEAKYCIDGDYTGEAHPVELAFERTMLAACKETGVRRNSITDLCGCHHQRTPTCPSKNEAWSR